MEGRLKISKLRKVAIVYGLCAVVLVPWIIMLAGSLPIRYRSQHWRGAWVGFDGMIIISLVATAVTLATRSLWTIMSATATGVLLVVDAWFDVLTSRAGSQAAEALALATFVELPLALLSFWIVASYINAHKSTDGT